MSVSFCIMLPMPECQEQFAASIAFEAVEILEDHPLFPGGSGWHRYYQLHLIVFHQIGKEDIPVFQGT